MRIHKVTILLFLTVLCIAGITAMATLRGQDESNSSASDQQKSNKIGDAHNLPTVDSSDPEPSESEKRAKRKAKGKKYNNKNALPIDESADQIFTVLDWDANLPAFPVAQSQAVIIGNVVDAQAHLSDDKADVYSEFTVRVDEVLKNDNRIPIAHGSSINVERKGGRVRFPSGHIVVSYTNHQRMPHAGGRYVLFLTHDFPMGGSYEQDFYIITGYELRASRVFPLDSVLSGHPITAYNGVDESSFLRDLRSVANPSPTTQPN